MWIKSVASYTLAWIEILLVLRGHPLMKRRKLHACVDLNFIHTNGSVLDRVASYTLAWIEIQCVHWRGKPARVASYTLAWIEMLLVFYNQEVDIVASYTLAWIEIGTPD